MGASQVVKPKFVIILGQSAAWYFLEFRHLSEVVGISSTRKEESYFTVRDCPLSHHGDEWAMKSASLNPEKE